MFPKNVDSQKTVGILRPVEKKPRSIVRWDWKDLPDWAGLNELLQPYGVKLVDVSEEGHDMYAVTVEPLEEEVE